MAKKPVNDKSRLDVELVRRKLARSREHSRDLIDQGRVIVAGFVATKPATSVVSGVSIVVKPDPAVAIGHNVTGEAASATAADKNFEDYVYFEDYVSRGAHKLIGALDAFNIDVTDRICLDAGASTGGFTDVLLRRRARLVHAVDVGYGQLAWSLQSDERVKIKDRTNIRYLTAEDLGEKVNLTVADLSFISLPLVLPALFSCTRDDGDVLPMVKPQFEVGKERLGPKGVVRSVDLRTESIVGVTNKAYDLGWGTSGVAASPLPGPAGNVEFFVWLRKDAGQPDPEAVYRVVQEASEKYDK